MISFLHARSNALSQAQLCLFFQDISVVFDTDQSLVEAVFMCSFPLDS